jgi:hypothetical protein
MNTRATIFWIMTPCILIDMYRCFIEIRCLKCQRSCPLTIEVDVSYEICSTVLHQFTGRKTLIIGTNLARNKKHAYYEALYYVPFPAFCFFLPHWAKFFPQHPKCEPLNRLLSHKLATLAQKRM